MVYNSESSWLDNINTIDYKEDLSDIIEVAVNDALNDIKNKFGSINWQWGKVNQPSYRHVLYGKKINCLINGLNVGPIERVGSNSGININEFNYTEDFDVVSGTALRKIFDLSDMNIGYTGLPTGQSGLARSEHYSDQSDLFKDHTFHKIEFNKDKIVNSDKYSKLVLYPTE